KIPVGYLLRTNMMPLVRNQYNSVADFFGGSCVPGIKGKSNMEISKKLCELCKDPTKCAIDDEYAGYDGAFNCMKDGSGEVAFVKHSTPIGKANQNDYRLLCRDGTQKEVTMYASCFTGKRPSGAIITASGNDASTIAMYRKLIKDVPLKVLIDAKILGSTVLSLNETDLTTTMFLGNYLGDIRALGKTNTSGGSSVAGWFVLQLLAAFSFFFVF
ncbi:hypothetical protein, partial [Salmonella sp. s54925]|uniref:hypothetical protein n=1 Tax=Salmonella sp. s54925 TaxID=3159674 RepID=UPI003980232E